MKAMTIREFGGPEVLTWEDVETPEPGPGQALVKVNAVGLNRMDVELRAGVYGKEPLTDFYFGKHMSFPHIAGIEPVGTVASLGAGVEGLEAGQRVIPHSHLSCGSCRQCLDGWDNACPNIRVLGVQTKQQGGYAEYFTWPVSHLIPLPDSLSDTAAAALLVNYGPVWFGVQKRAKLEPGETLLITGATGGCGQAAIDIGQLLGARIIATAGSDDKIQALHDRGVDEVIDYRKGSVAEAVLEATAGAGADVVCELVGADTWNDSVSAAGIRGRVVVIGSHGGLRASLNLGEVFGKNLQIIGVTRANHATMAQLVELAAQGRLDPQVWKTLPLTEAGEAHRLMEQREHQGKIVLTLD